MGGERVGKGSTFHFTAHFGIPQGTSAHTWVNLEGFSNIPVLVVDDNDTNRRILEDVLTNWTMRPKLASCGPEALLEMAEAAARGEPYPLASWTS